MLVAPACARSSTPAVETPPAEARAPKAPADPLALAYRVYELGESAWQGGAKFQAVALWRQSFLSIPPDEKYDVLRHRMVMRIGWALLELHAIDRDDYHLRAAQQMVARWIDARAGRDESGAAEEAYALLSEIELRLEDPSQASASGDEEHARSRDEGARMAAGYEGKQAQYREGESHAGETLDAEGVTRKIEVSQLATLDDPRVRAFLEHPAPEGPSLFDLPGEALNPTRPLVRAGLPKITTKARGARFAANRETWRLVKELRPQLEYCYASSMARAPTDVVRMRVRLSVDAEGHIQAKRSEGDPLGDALGDDCIRRVFERAAVVDPELHGQELAVVPLTFFIQLGQGLSPSLQGLPGFDANMADREGSYRAARQTETGMGVAVGQPAQ